jgi:hypothetical protein
VKEYTPVLHWQGSKDRGLGFDMYGGEFTHHGEDCAFETMIRRFGLGDWRRPGQSLLFDPQLHLAVHSKPVVV